MATFRHKTTGELFTAEKFSVLDQGVVYLQRLRVDGELILGGDAEIDAYFAAEPVDEQAREMFRKMLVGR